MSRRGVTVAAMSTPRTPVTAERLRAELARDGTVPTGTMDELLGAKRAHANVPMVEQAVREAGLCSDDHLATAKSTVSGRPVLRDGDRATTRVPIQVVKSAGVVELDRARATVAAVTDSDEHLAAATSALGLDHTPDVVVVTVAQLRRLVSDAYQGTSGDLPPVGSLDEVLAAAVTEGASDVIVKQGDAPALRVRGDVRRTQTAPTDSGWFLSLQRDPRYDPGGFVVDLGRYRARVTPARDDDGELVVARLLPPTPPRPEDLGLPDRLHRAAVQRRGLLLVAGAAGAGKTTTSASLLAYLARHHPRHVITLEDPVEYRIPSVAGVVSQRERGAHFDDLRHETRRLSRHSPDVVYLADVTGAEQARCALDAAETGALVIATIHAYDTATAVDALVAKTAPEERADARRRVADTLNVVSAQTLLDRADRAGRVAAFEVLDVDAPTRSAIADNDAGAVRWRLQQNESGTSSLDHALADLVAGGAVKREVAEARAISRDLLDAKLAAAGGAGR